MLEVNGTATQQRSGLGRRATARAVGYGSVGHLMYAQAILPGLVAVALGVAQAVLWVASRRSPQVWRRNVSAFAPLTSRKFAEGYAGAAIFNAAGLLLFGVGNMLAGWVHVRYTEQSLPVPPALSGKALRMMVGAPLLLVLSIISSFAKWPRWLFPPHAR